MVWRFEIMSFSCHCMCLFELLLEISENSRKSMIIYPEVLCPGRSRIVSSGRLWPESIRSFHEPNMTRDLRSMVYPHELDQRQVVSIRDNMPSLSSPNGRFPIIGQVLYGRICLPPWPACFSWSAPIKCFFWLAHADKMRAGVISGPRLLDCQDFNEKWPYFERAGAKTRRSGYIKYAIFTKAWPSRFSALAVDLDASRSRRFCTAPHHRYASQGLHNSLTHNAHH